MILMSLLLAGEPDDMVPPVRPVSISLSVLARSFGISRTQVRKLLHRAVSDGLLERVGTASDSVRIMPQLAEGVRDTVPIYIARNIHCARTALAEIGAQRAIA